MTRRETPMGALALLLFIPSLAVAQQAGPERLDVAGLVADATTGDPVAGAALSIEGTRLRILTDGDGRFVLRGIPRGEHTWVIESLGYATWRQPLAVEHLDQLRIGLMPRPVDLEAITVTVDRLEERRRLASYAVYTLARDELRSSSAIEAAELIRSRVPWPKVVCDTAGARGPAAAPGSLCVRYRGAIARAGVCLDERPIPLAALSAYVAEEIHAIDFVGGPAPQVRVYTARFLASGRPIRPLAFGCR